MREVIRIRKMDQDDYDERLALLDTYMNAIGMLKGTPLGEAGARTVDADA